MNGFPTFAPLPTPAEMAAWDRAAMDEFGVKEELLMENAGREAFETLEAEYGEVSGSAVLLFAGPGNNGGDAFVVARYLLDAGALPLVLHTKALGSYKGAAGYHARLAKRSGVPMRSLRRIDPRSLPAPDVVVDGLLGTGFTGELRADVRDLVDCINEFGETAFVLALDIPSGLDGLTGTPCPVAVLADATATFGAAKAGLVGPDADMYTGELYVCPIGIPALVMEETPCVRQLLTEEVVAFLPVPESAMHKGDAGRVLVVGGSRGLSGAPALAGLGALRAGAGLVTVAVPGALAAAVTAFMPDLMTLPVGSNDGWAGDAEELTGLAGINALAVGPGLGRSKGAGSMLAALLGARRAPAVLDADGLFWLAQDKNLLKKLTPTDVLTPHPGEMARMLGLTTAQVQADRTGAALKLARRTGAVVVLKGAGTVVAIAGPDGEAAYVSPVSAPCLSVGGSGDVLSGVIAALMAGGVEPLPAACLGVYWHGVAGLLLEEEYPLRGNLAQEIAHALPAALSVLLEQEEELC